MSDIAKKIKDIIAEKLEVDADKVTDSAAFVDDLGADSLNMAELVMDLEDHFDITISEADAEKLRTVGDVIEFIKEKQA